MVDRGSVPRVESVGPLRNVKPSAALKGHRAQQTEGPALCDLELCDPELVTSPLRALTSPPTNGKENRSAYATGSRGFHEPTWVASRGCELGRVHPKVKP